MVQDNIKAKGDELVRNFKGSHLISGGIGMIEKQAIYCSIIAVEEIITKIKQIQDDYDDNFLAHYIDRQTEILNYLRSKL